MAAHELDFELGMMQDLAELDESLASESSPEQLQPEASAASATFDGHSELERKLEALRHCIARVRAKRSPTADRRATHCIPLIARRPLFRGRLAGPKHALLRQVVPDSTWMAI